MLVELRSIVEESAFFRWGIDGVALEFMSGAAVRAMSAAAGLDWRQASSIP